MRRWLIPVGVYVTIAIVLTRHLLARFTSTLPHDAGDPMLNTWILWWSTQRLPLTAAWWNAPMFYPMTGALALSEVLIGLLPITAPVQFLTHSPLIAYNTAFVLSFPLCGLAMYALAVELTGRRDVALLAGIAFLFAPYRMGQLAHVQMLAYYWAPVALLGLHRYVRTLERRWLVLFAGAWLMQALSNGYALFHLSIFVALWIVWFARPLSRAAAIVAAWACAALGTLPVLLKYREVHDSLHLVRSINEIKGFGVDLADLFTSPYGTVVWGPRLWTARPETAVFPGVTMIVVGVVWLGFWWMKGRGDREPATLDQRVLVIISGVAGAIALSAMMFGPWALGPLTVTDFHKPFSIAVAARLLAWARGPWARRAWRERSTVGFYVIAMFAMYLLAMGPEPRILGRPLLYQPPYAWLMHLPGFSTLRVPARFAMLGILCQSLLFAMAVARWSVARRSPLVIALIGIALMGDGWAHMIAAPIPDPGPAWQDVQAVLEWPPGGNGDFDAIYRQMVHGRPIVNGYSGYNPPHYLPLVYAIGEGQYSAVYELAGAGPLGIAVNRASPGAAAAETQLSALNGVGRVPAPEGWAGFVVQRRPLPTDAVRSAIGVHSVWANRHNEDIGRLSDGKIETAWGAGLSQIGDEELVVDLGAPQAVGAVVLRMGAYSFGFPRALEVDASMDDTNWTAIWAGSTAVQAVHAAVTAPGSVPLTIDLGRVSARYLRLRQVGSEPGIPWWIAELEVFAPVPPADLR